MFNNNNDEMNKLAASVQQEGFNLGVELYGIFKQASLGDPEAIEFVNEAMKQAEGEMPPEAGMGAPAPEAGMAAPAPGPTIVCPQCGNEVTPTPDGLCPVCGFDFNQLAAAAEGGEMAPAPAPEAPAPTEEQVTQAAEGIKQAAINDPVVAQWLLEHYGNRI